MTAARTRTLQTFSSSRGRLVAATGGLALLLLALSALGYILLARARPSTANALLGFLPVPIAPQAAAREDASLCGDIPNAGGIGSPDIKNLRVHGTRPMPHNGRLVLYSADCSPADRRAVATQVFSYALVTPRGPFWETTGISARFEGSGQATDANLVAYDTRGNHGEGYAIVFGWVTSPRVAAVEASFDNGQIRRDGVIDGVFALTNFDAHAVCELRVVDSNDRVLERIAIPSFDMHVDPTAPGVFPQNTCP